MSIRLPFAAAAVLALGGCMPLPYDVGVSDWEMLSPQQRVELRRQWYMQAHGLAQPAVATAPTPIATVPVQVVPGARKLEEENADLQRRLEDSERRLARAERRLHALTDALAGDDPPPLPPAAPAAAPAPAPAAAPLPAVTP